MWVGVWALASECWRGCVSVWAGCVSVYAWCVSVRARVYVCCSEDVRVSVSVSGGEGA